MGEKVNMTPAEVYRAIIGNQPVVNASVMGKTNIKQAQGKDTISSLVVFRDCFIEELDASYLVFYGKCQLINCVIRYASFQASFFPEGLLIDGCEFERDMFLMDMGGRNLKRKPIIIRNTTFHGYVDLEDARFEGPFEMTNCRFDKGTNLLGNQKKPTNVKFDVPPVINGNTGRLDLDGSLFEWGAVAASKSPVQQAREALDTAIREARDEPEQE